MKFRTAYDRHVHHGHHSRGQLHNKYYYGYIIKASDLQRAVFGGIGISNRPVKKNENLGQSQLSTQDYLEQSGNPECYVFLGGTLNFISCVNQNLMKMLKYVVRPF
jgi:hypothetical protein